MATRDKRRRWTPRRKRQAATDEDASPGGEKASKPEEPETAPAIKKGIYLSALIYVEGVQPAPEDFTPVATGALKEALESALKQGNSAVKMTLKKIEPRTDIEQDDGEKEEKFQF